MLCTDDDKVIIPYALSKCEKRFLVKWLTDVRGYDREIIVMFSNRSAHVRSFSDEVIEERPAQKRMKNEVTETKFKYNEKRFKCSHFVFRAQYNGYKIVLSEDIYSIESTVRGGKI